MNNTEDYCQHWYQIYNEPTEVNPLTCADCREPLSDDEVTDYYNDIEEGDKSYCFSCVGKMRVAEYTGEEE